MKIIVPSLLLLVLASGCVLAPRQEWKQEKSKLKEAGEPFAAKVEERQLPEIGAAPGWRDVLQRALLANGELEAAYFEWAMAVSRIRQAGAYPNTPVSVGFEYMLSGDNLKAWDRTTVTVAPDTMQNLSFPTKVYQGSKIALHEAQAAGERFRAAKFELQRKVLGEWVDYALLAQRVRVGRESLALLKVISETSAARVQAGRSQQDVLRAEIAYRTAENNLKSLEAEQSRARAMLNAMLARPADAPLPAPTTLIEPRAVPADDAKLLTVAAESNPSLAALARQLAGRSDALELARMQYIPDFNPMAGFTGSMSQFVGIGITLPTVIPKIEGMIEEARADLRRVQAMYRQAQLDKAASVVAAIYALRDAERKAQFFQVQLLPPTQRLADLSRQTYEAGGGGGSFSDLVEAQRTLLDMRLMIAEARAAREKSLADLEALLGVDIETLQKLEVSSQ